MRGNPSLELLEPVDDQVELPDRLLLDRLGEPGTDRRPLLAGSGMRGVSNAVSTRSGLQKYNRSTHVVLNWFEELERLVPPKR